MSEVMIAQQQETIRMMVTQLMMVSNMPGSRPADTLRLVEQIAAEVIFRTTEDPAQHVDVLTEFTKAVLERLASYQAKPPV